ncbi:HesB/IscA family protein [Chloroherpeton thalassium]|nr:iron-sulfur cluster biosynthesis family protein [Chloroherpeton thalassium]
MIDIKITKAAEEKIHDLTTSGEVEQGTIRVATGCAACGGLSFALDFNTKKKPDDALVPHDKWEFAVGREVQELVENITIDYVENEFGGNFIIETAYGTSACWW